MEQATQQTSSTTPPETRAAQPQDRQADSFEHAAALAAWYFRHLTSKPYATELTEDFPIGCTAHLKFRDGDTRGVTQFAEIANAPITQANTEFGMHLEVYVRHDSVLMRASTLILHGQGAQLDGEPAAAPAEEPETITMQPAPSVVPLGSSVNAVVTVVHAPSEDAETAGGEQ